MQEIDDFLNTLNGIATKLTEPKVKFNVLTALHIERREVYICRLIGGLLDHNSRIKELFRKKVLEVEDDTFEDAEIIIEDLIDGQRYKDITFKRRVDIVIKTKKRIYPIEAKIDADDQPSQLCTYWHYYNKTDHQRFKDDCPIYYLTPTLNKKPSSDSIGDIANKVTYITFSEHIMKWLKAVEIECAEVRYAVRQFQEVVEKMNTTNEIINTLFPENNIFDNISGVGMLLEHQNAIMEKVKKTYIANCFKNTELGSDYKLRIKENSEDSRELYDVFRDDEKIATICVDTNLYLYPDSNHKSEIRHGEEQWEYLYRDSKKDRINLKYFWKNKSPLRKDDRFENLNELLNKIH